MALTPTQGRRIWLAGFLVLAFFFVVNVVYAIRRGELTDLALVFLFLLGIPAGISFWRWQHYRKVRG